MKKIRFLLTKLRSKLIKKKNKNSSTISLNFNNKGFSLVELLVVMVILSMLAALVGPKVFRHLDSAKQKDAAAQIAMFEETLELYRLEKHKYPDTLEKIKDYLKKELPKDPWGNPYIYKMPGDEGRDFEITSYGADGNEGGDGIDADIFNWKSGE